MTDCFVAQFTEDGGPPPAIELDRIVAQSEPADDQEQPEFSWIPTRKGSGVWQQSKNAQCVVFCRVPDGVDAVWAKIVGSQREMPDVAAVKDFYGAPDCYNFPVWWKVKDVKRLRWRSIKDIPGRSGSGLRASETFSGNCTFAYWNFSDQCVESLEAAARGTLALEPDAGDVRARPFRAEPSFGGAAKGHAVLHGVDFSGCREHRRRNAKIWIATWDVANEQITLEQGSTHGFGRADLAGRVRAEKGWWCFDFPFGVAKRTAAALGVSSPEGWFQWCFGEHRGEGYATLRRDAARDILAKRSVNWSERRNIDTTHGTTWFPLFEQLYRQTIYGAAEFLHELHKCKETARILPWDVPVPTIANVVEGFPGVILRERLQLPATGYKGRSSDRRQRREEIIRMLKQRFRLPISPSDEHRAVADTEGDAVDALILLVACQISAGLPSEKWLEERTKLRERGTWVEGWFPA